MRGVEREKHKEELVKFLTAMRGKRVYVAGMWTGEIIGVVSDVGWTEVSFRVEKTYSKNGVHQGDTVTFPYGIFMKVRELTDAEKQITISEAVGDIEIK